MSPNSIEQKQHAHLMIDLLAPEKLRAVVGLLEVMLDPVTRAVASAPVDSEPVTLEEECAFAPSREWLRHNSAVPHAQLLNELGITQERDRAMPGTCVTRIAWTGRARTDIRALDKLIAMRVLYALDRFAESGIGNVKTLQGSFEELRLRVAHYRLVFVYTDDGVIEISSVQNPRQPIAKHRSRHGAPTRQRNARAHRGTGRNTKSNRCL